MKPICSPAHARMPDRRALVAAGCGAHTAAAYRSLPWRPTGSLMAKAKDDRWGHRDATMILVAYRHGLRVSELVDLRWEQVDFRTAALHVRSEQEPKSCRLG
jgi:integrase